MLKLLYVWNVVVEVIEPTRRRIRRALEKGEKYYSLSKIELKKKL